MDKAIFEGDRVGVIDPWKEGFSLKHSTGLVLKIWGFECYVLRDGVKNLNWVPVDNLERIYDGKG